MSKRGGKKKGGKGREAPVEEPAAASVVLSPRTVTGTLSSHPLSRDVRFRAVQRFVICAEVLTANS